MCVCAEGGNVALESIPLLEAVVNTPEVPVTTTKFVTLPIAPAFVMLPCVWALGSAVIVISAEPLKLTPLIVLAVVNVSALGW